MTKRDKAQKAYERLRAITWAATVPAERRYSVGPGGDEETYASFAEMLGAKGEVISVEEETDGTRVYHVRHEKPYFSWLPADKAYDHTQIRLGWWFIEKCEQDGEVARIAINTLEEEINAFKGPEGVRAKATLRHLIEIATRPRMELVGFPEVSEPNP